MLYIPPSRYARRTVTTTARLAARQKNQVDAAVGSCCRLFFILTSFLGGQRMEYNGNVY